MTVPSPRVRRLPERGVAVELVDSPDAVEAEPTTLPALAPAATWRRWAWAVVLVPTVALVVYQRLAGGQGWPVTDVVVLATTAGLVMTALLALVRYQDDRAVARLARDRAALLAAPVRATGTLTLAPTAEDEPARPARGGLRGTLVLTTAAGTATARPVRVVVPEQARGPRPGDPVAVWHAADDEDAGGAVLVRYHRAWADDLVAALRARVEEGSAPPHAGDAAREVDRDGDDVPGPRNPADRAPGAE